MAFWNKLVIFCLERYLAVGESSSSLHVGSSAISWRLLFGAQIFAVILGQKRTRSRDLFSVFIDNYLCDTLEGKTGSAQ